MAKFLSRSFEHNSRHFHIELDIGQWAALTENLVISITARSWNADGSGGSAVEAEVKVDLERREIIVSVEGEELGRIPLDAERTVPEHLDSDERDETDWRWIAEQLASPEDSAADMIGQIIDSIPAIDPLLGCVLRGTISATVVQLIACHNATPRDVESVRHRVRWLAKCLGINMLSLLEGAVRKTLLCIVRGGF